MPAAEFAVLVISVPVYGIAQVVLVGLTLSLFAWSGNRFRTGVTAGWLGFAAGGRGGRTSCARDNGRPPAVQRAQAARAGRTVEIEAGHQPMLSRPGLVADLVLDLLPASRSA